MIEFCIRKHLFDKDKWLLQWRVSKEEYGNNIGTLKECMEALNTIIKGAYEE